MLQLNQVRRTRRDIVIQMNADTEGTDPHGTGAAKVVQHPATKVVPLPATKVAQHRVARVALAHGWKRRLAVAVTRSRLLRVVDQPSHRVHRDR